jgi:hypothetical protein
MMTLEESRGHAITLAAAGYAAVVIHAPEWRDDWDDESHAYTYQPAEATTAAGESIVERYPAVGTPAYLTATAADVLRGWQEAYGARTPVERELIAECHQRSQETGLTMFVILAEAERYWRSAGRAADPRRWRARAAACRRMLDHTPSEETRR